MGSGRRDPRQSGREDRRTADGRGRRVPPRQVAKPLTAAEQRAAEVRATRGPRPPKTESAPPAWEREQWVDEGSIRSSAVAAAHRAEAPARRRRDPELAPEVLETIGEAAPPARAAHYRERLASAADALDRGRYEDAKRMVQPVLREVPDIAFAHEIAGLAWYRLGQWRKAAVELELARGLDNSPHHLPVLADCYRALRRYGDVAVLWEELRQESPNPALMAEGRIVAAGALADQGNVRGALALMAKAANVPKRIKDHHVRQWYMMGDLYDRQGDVISARRYFGLVHSVDPGFVDVAERIAGLGR